MHGVFTTLFFMITLRREVSFLEKLGTFIVCIGAALMISDPEAKRVGHAARTLASLSSLLANIPGALFWATSKILEQKMSIINLVFAQMLILDVALICLSMYFEGATLDTSNKGIFGFMQDPFVSFFLNGFMSGFWGICGYVIACKYYPPVVIMNCLLLEPIVG